jgi:hypothetical protein
MDNQGGSVKEKSGATPTIYQFRIREQLDDHQRCDWFGDLQMVRSGGQTILWGAVPDQAALYGIIARVSGLGMTLLSVTRVQTRKTRDKPDESRRTP